MSYNLNISRHNFKQQRECYSITVKEIADICNLSPQTVINFEKGSGKYTDTMSRDYNSDMMINTLRSLIEGKLDAMKARQLNAISNEVKNDIPVKKEEHTKEDKRVIRTGVFADSNVPRQKLVDYIKSYCKHNSISTIDFCRMCKINQMFCAPSSAKRDGREFVGIGTLEKVLSATGWKEEQILDGFKPDIPEKKAPDPVVKECNEVISFNSGAKLADLNTANRTITNVKYICENGKFYKEYDVITHMKLDISRDTFLKEISGGDQS